MERKRWQEVSTTMKVFLYTMKNTTLINRTITLPGLFFGVKWEQGGSFNIEPCRYKRLDFAAPSMAIPNRNRC